MLTLNEHVPLLPIHILCRHYCSIDQIPVVAATDDNNVRDKMALRTKVSPQDRWSLLRLVELILHNSVSEQYRERNHNALAEVAYIIEKSLLETAETPAEYLHVQTLHQRLCSVAWSMAGTFVVDAENSELYMYMLPGRSSHMDNNASYQYWLDEYNNGAGAA